MLIEHLRAAVPGPGGHILLTQGVASLNPADKAAVLRKVRGTDQFDRDSDPHHAHDFVAIEHKRIAHFWEIDCYDLDCRYGSPDPTNPAVTTRVLTVMRADEYWARSAAAGGTRSMAAPFRRADDLTEESR